MDGDYVERRGSDVQVREPSVLQVVEVALGQSVPVGVGQLMLSQILKYFFFFFTGVRT